MIIELPRNALNETQHTCQFEDNLLSLNRLITEIQANIEKKSFKPKFKGGNEKLQIISEIKEKSKGKK
jgi:hypothetical protein